jgi:hypothetical protein
VILGLQGLPSLEELIDTIKTAVDHSDILEALAVQTRPSKQVAGDFKQNELFTQSLSWAQCNCLYWEMIFLPVRQKVVQE